MLDLEIGGRRFQVHAQETLDDYTGLPTGRWHAWCFFAYDRDIQIFPADSVPHGAITQESIIGEGGATEEAACRAVEAKLRHVIETKSLDGTGFYSPPADKVFPQEFDGRKPADLRRE